MGPIASQGWGVRTSISKETKAPVFFQEALTPCPPLDPPVTVVGVCIQKPCEPICLTLRNVNIGSN